MIDDPAEDVDLSAVAGWSVAVCVTLAWIYFAIKAGRSDRSRHYVLGFSVSAPSGQTAAS
ncbi:hypothetical protein E1267_12010 [Nonomuraea longispora]|uniref:Uncharacterized protein n=1 Tax=Nonomuraea longispora TaxID=1848320 RepID=A0A4R4NJL8_9ACTN|nr:hypothetical protein [Nonomuraea longispora]TDC07933.1 hypothetical protein E1267_12010 [Nonomuraea longispora]